MSWLLESTFLLSRARPTSAGNGLLTLVAGLTFWYTTADGRELLQNVDFNGDPEVWYSEARSSLPAEEPRGDWFLDDIGTLTPWSGSETSSGGLAEGNYGVSDHIDEGPNQRGANESIMRQNFVVPENPESVVVSFDMFVNDWSHRTSFTALQHARVDIIKGDADHYDVDEGVLVNLYLGTDGGPVPNSFLRYQFEIAPFLQSGGEFAIRFYEINGIDTLNVGVDNASIQLVPEPSTAILLLIGLACVALILPHRVAAVAQR